MPALMNQNNTENLEMTPCETRWWVVAFYVCIIAAATAQIV